VCSRFASHCDQAVQQLNKPLFFVRSASVTQHFAEQKGQAVSEATQQMLLSAVQSSEEKLQAFQQKVEQQVELVEVRRVAQEAAGAEVRAEAAKQAARLAREQQEAMQQAATQQAEALAQQAAAQQAQEAAAQGATAQQAAAQQAAAQQAAAQQAAVQQAAAQQAAAHALAHQQQQAQHGGQQWRQQQQCGGHNQMQGNAGNGGEPPPQGGPVCTICQRTLCAVCLHQRGGVLGGSPRCAVGGCMNLAQAGNTLCTAHLGGAAPPQPQQQPQAAAGEDQLAAISGRMQSKPGSSSRWC
jgi:hypothetical protein